MLVQPVLAGWSLWLPLEGEGTGVGRWPLRKFSLLVDSERNIDQHHDRVPAARAFRASASAGRGDSNIPGLRIHPPETPDPEHHHHPGMPKEATRVA
jgi:hypothetical protein